MAQLRVVQESKSDWFLLSSHCPITSNEDKNIYQDYGNTLQYDGNICCQADIMSQNPVSI